MCRDRQADQQRWDSHAPGDANAAPHKRLAAKEQTNQTDKQEEIIQSSALKEQVICP
ncbi:MAG: hypothetical protein ACJASZ_002867 [Yoonia sp.]